MVEQISQMALETLRDLLIEEARFLSGVGGQVEEVERELKTIHCFLKDADSRPDRYKSATVSHLVAELKEIAYKAENVLEKYAIEVTSKREVPNLRERLKRYACILSECVKVHQVGKDIETIRSRMATLSSKLESMPPIGDSSSNDQQLRQTHGHKVEKYFVGMEKDIKHLVSLVKDDERSNPVISIYGMGGLGKTTLAGKIYQHDDVKRGFEAHAWVCISQQFQEKTALQQILKQLLSNEMKDEIEKMDESELVRELYNVQKQKKCFVVIDDIWETDHWNILKSAFPITEANCKVLLTTRDKRIASEECVYELKYLTEEQGWELLQKIALPQGLKTGLGEYETLGREIVQKCGRLPLSISAIGGILRHKLSLSEWQSVSSNIDSYLRHGEGVGENKRVSQVLDLSYNSLPYYLKPCFLYLGCFPEDTIIDTERLYLLWIAEGMVSSEDKGRNETLRDVAKRYLSELAFRCMVQVEVVETLSFQLFRLLETCRLHDLMRDLCLRKGEEERFLKVVDFYKGSERITSNDAAIIPRLSVYFDDHQLEDNFKERDKLIESLKSLLVLGKSQDRKLKFCSEHSLTDSNKLKFLRILILENFNFESSKFPSELRKLIHLRYLSLFGSVVYELPPFVCDFPYLQTLDLRVSMDHFTLLPNVICKMKRLRHLFLNYDSRGIIGNKGEKLRLDGLEELETLVGFCSKYDCAEDIPKLTNLQRLSAQIWNEEGLSMIVDHISSKQNRLRETNLHILMCDFTSDLLEKMFMSPSLVRLCTRDCTFDCNILPSYQQGMCANLVSLSLFSCVIEGDVMETFGKFPVLAYLRLGYLRSNNLVNGEMICHANSFPQLKTLELSYLYNLEKWRVDEGAMPNLSSLKIRCCGKLGMIPDGLRHVTTLQDLTVFGYKEFNDRLRVVNGPDYYKVAHIPSISLNDY